MFSKSTSTPHHICVIPLFTTTTQSGHTTHAKTLAQVSFNPFLFVLNGDSETFLQQRQFADQVGDGVREGFLLKQSQVRLEGTMLQHRGAVSTCPLTCGL